MWTWIPQVHYDFLARIVPGATLVLVATMVVFGPATAIQSVLDGAASGRLFAFGPLVLWVLFSYLTGLVLSQLWGMTFGRHTLQAVIRAENECKARCLVEHNEMQRALGNNTIELPIEALPRAFVMRCHLRGVDPLDMSRLVKLRAERRLCQALVFGLILLAGLNAGYMVRGFTSHRLLLQVLMVVTSYACWVRSTWLHRYIVEATCASWFAHVAARKILVPPAATAERDAGGD